MESIVDRTTAEGTYSPVQFTGAFVRQFKLLWTSRRPLLLIVALLGLLVLSGPPWSPDPRTRLLSAWPLWLVVVGPLWAFAVFHNEGPSNRLYHWSLPTGRVQHTLARLTAGIAWLWTAYAVLIGVGIVMAAMDGDLWQLEGIPAAAWVNCFTGPLLGYLAVSVLTVVSDYPIRWFFGLLFAFPITLNVIDDWLGLDHVARALVEPLGSQDWGFFPVIVGAMATAAESLRNELRAATDPSAQPHTQVLVEHWWLATAVWIAVMAGLVVLASSRHPDRLPTLRRPRRG